jgi:hypothetical protein
VPTTPRMTIPYPTENQDPFYDAFLGMLNALDASLYASREDRHLVFMNGGTFSFAVNPTTGVGTLTWTQPINIIGAVTGFLWSVPAGSRDIDNGAIAYVDLARAAVVATSLSMNVAMQVPATNASLLFGIHKGSIFYFRNGRCIHDGESFAALDTSTGAGGGGGTSRAVKDPCLVATTTPITFAGGAPATVDGVGLVLNARVLVKDQGSAQYNGIYVVDDVGTGADGTWSRAPDFATSTDVIDGVTCVVNHGNTYTMRMFELVTTDPVILGTTPLAWSLLSTIGLPTQKLISTIPIVLNQSTSLTSFQAVGHYAVNPNDFVVAGTTLSCLFQAVGFVTGTAEGTVELYDLTISAAVAGGSLVFIAGTTTPTNMTGTVTLAAGSHVYEIRTKVSAGTGTFFCDWAGLQFRNTF